MTSRVIIDIETASRVILIDGFNTVLLVHSCFKLDRSFKDTVTVITSYFRTLSCLTKTYN